MSYQNTTCNQQQCSYVLDNQITHTRTMHETTCARDATLNIARGDDMIYEAASLDVAR